MAKRSARAIDSDKLRAAVFAKGMTLADASRSIGMAHNAIGNWLSRREIPVYAIILLEKEIGIPYDEYKKDDPAEEKTDKTERQKKPCHYCEKDECAIFASGMDERLNLTVNIRPGRRIMDAYLTFGNEIVMSENTFIRYCPFCGRELV